MIAMLINPYVLYQSLNIPWLNGLFSWIDVASSDTSSVVLGFCVASISTYVTYVKLRYYGLTLRMLLLVYPFFPIKWCKQISQYEQKYTELSSHVKSVQVKQTPKPPKHEVFCQAFSTGIVSSNALLTIFAKDDETWVKLQRNNWP